MSILDDLFAYDEEEDQRIADESKAILEQSSSSVPQSDEMWLTSVASPTKASSIVPPLRTTILRKVHTSKLVWAKCHYFKGGHAEFPGRIAELSEAACQIDIPVAILPTNELIEFFSIPKKDPSVPQYVIVEKCEIRPYNASIAGRKQLSLMNSFSTQKSSNNVDHIGDQEWDVGHFENMREKLKEKYNVSVGNTVYAKIKEKANEFLKNAIDYNRLDALAANIDDDGDARDLTSNLEADADAVAGVDLFSLVSSKGGAQLTITAGRWISFQHKIFKDKTVYVRVVEVTGNAKEPLLLENDDVLMPRDMVCLLDEIPVGSPTNSDTYEASGKKGLKNIFVEGKGGYVKGSGSSRPIKEYKMKVGKIDYVSVHQLQCRAVPRDALLMEEYAEASVSTTISSSSRCGKESTTKCDDEDEIIFGDEEHLPADRRRKEVTHYVNDLTESPEPVPKKRSRVDP